LTPAIRIEIIRLYKNDLTAYAIANQLRIRESSAHRLIRRYNEERDITVHSSTGRPRKTNEEDDVFLACAGKKK